MGRGGWWVVSGRGKGVQKPDGLYIFRQRFVTLRSDL